MNKSQDLGNKSIGKLFLQLAIPAVIAQIVNLLYNIVNRIYIGHIEGGGSLALTGVGLFMPMLMLMNAFAMLAAAGGAPLASIACQQCFMALGQVKISLFLACLRKLILLIPLIFILPFFFENQVFGVFVAEPVSDIVAALVTSISFFTQFNRMLKKDIV